MARKRKSVEPTVVKTAGINAKRGVSSAPDGLYDPANPGHRWERPLQAPGRMQVDFEERVDFRRLHEYRLARTRNSLAKSKLGALLVFDQYNMRYISSTVIGEWARERFNSMVGLVFLLIVLFSPDGLLGWWAYLRSRTRGSQVVWGGTTRHPPQ